MARLYCSGYELDSTTSGVEVTTWNFLAHTAPTIVTTPTVSATSGFAMRCSPSANQSLVDYVFSTGTGGAIIGTWINFSVLPTANLSMLDIGTLSAAYGALFIDSTGKFGVNYNVGATSTYDTARSVAITTNTWHYIELQITATGANAQTVVGRLDGVQIASKSGTLTAGANSITLAAWGAGCRETGTCTVFFDDTVINDTTGTAENTFPYNSNGVYLARLSPSGTGDSNTFATQTGGTAGSANNYTRVNEVTPDGATSFNGDSTVGHSDLYAVSSATGSIPSGATINALQMGVWFARAATGTGAEFQVQLEKTSGGTLAASAAIQPIGNAYRLNGTGSTANSPLTLYNDPDGSPFTTTTIASTQFGMAIVTGGGAIAADISTLWAYVDYTPSTSGAISVSDSTITSESLIELVTGFIRATDSTTTAEILSAAEAIQLSISDSTISSETVPTPGLSYGVDVDPSQMNPTTGAYFVQGIKVV